MIHPTATPIEVEKDGVVRSFPYHDGTLDGILVDGKGSALLAITSIDGERRVLTLTGVTDLCVDEFRQGNIVVEVYVMTHDMFRANGSMVARIAKKLMLDPDRLPEGTYVFAVESAYGADIIAVCRDIRVTGGYLAPVEADVSRP